MERIEHTDKRGRKYEAIQGDSGMTIIAGPPEGLVDSLGLPEPFATNLHNAMYRLRLFNMASISKNPNHIMGALQEAYGVDASRLTEALLRYETEPEVNHEQITASPHRPQ